MHPFVRTQPVWNTKSHGKKHRNHSTTRNTNLNLITVLPSHAAHDGHGLSAEVESDDDPMPRVRYIHDKIHYTAGLKRKAMLFDDLAQFLNFFLGFELVTFVEVVA